MAKKQTSPKKTKSQDKVHDIYDDYKYKFDKDKELRRFIDVLYSLFIFLLGMGLLVAWWYFSKYYLYADM